jgi:Ser-tRNA(Ala) deacylase AlaX
MAVLKKFWEDPYLYNIEAKITSVDGVFVTLDQTVFYAFSGGQQSDIGTIGRYEVLEAVTEGLEIKYRLTDDHALAVGDEVLLQIDSVHRDKLRRLHFATELVLELVYQNYGHPHKTGANITSEKARVDFVWEGNISETFPFLANKLKELIDADLPVISTYEDEPMQRRTWEIEGFAKVSCGGTHPRSTKEIGAVVLKRVNPGGKKERIEITLVP